MAEKRMFSKQIIDSDAFLEMPLSTQALYFHLSMRADDDGFVDNPKKIQRMISASGDDLKLLIAKRYILTFESGVIVIKHWRIHNTLRTDRYKETVYLEEKSTLLVKDNKSYTEKDKLNDIGIPNGNQMEPQYRLDKDSIDKINKDSVVDSIEPTHPAEYIPRYSIDSFEIKCVELLISSCLAECNTSKVPTEIKSKEKWADEIEKMKRIDKRSEVDIKKALDFAINDKFWKSNIRSTKKFREKFETLFIQSNGKPKSVQQKPSNNKFNNFPQRDYDFDKLEKSLIGNNG